jgi:DNA repair protein RadC
MAELSHNGHRERMKKSFVNLGADYMEEHQLLELLLSLIIPQRDVKQLAYNLINRFGTFDKVFSASIDELMEISGIGENTAILISLINAINERIESSKSEELMSLNNSAVARKYVKNLLSKEQDEKMIVITMDNDFNVINNHYVSDGTVNFAEVESKKIIECAIKDNASSVIMAHNHPSGWCYPSQDDVNFTIEVLNIFRKLGVELSDHIIVGGEKVFSMNSSPKYMSYFE